MTKRILLLACLLALRPAFAQAPPLPGAPTAPAPLPRTIDPMTGASGPVLTKFSLDFPGGTPKQLIAAIEKATGKPLNAIIPPEHGDVKLPPLKMNNVNVDQLFQALMRTSRKAETYVTGTSFGGGGGRPGSTYQQVETSYGFMTTGLVSDDSIWFFFVIKPPVLPPDETLPPKVCRYFSLAPYLEDGQTVEDITTAIQTGWKMLGDDDTPKISFHKETKLLIAVGEPEKLETIDAVLTALKPRPPAAAFIDPATGLPVPAGVLGKTSKP